MRHDIPDAAEGVSAHAVGVRHVWSFSLAARVTSREILMLLRLRPLLNLVKRLGYLLFFEVDDAVLFVCLEQLLLQQTQFFPNGLILTQQLGELVPEPIHLLQLGKLVVGPLLLGAELRIEILDALLFLRHLF